MSNSQFRWPFLKDQIRNRRCTPLIGNSLTMDHIFASHDLVQAWAAHINYPMTDRNRLSRVAQFLQVTSGDEILPKIEYLDFLKRFLLEQTKAGQKGQPDISLDGLTFSEAAVHLGYADFENRPDNSLIILARLPFRVYLTTSYHTLLEEALKAVGKEPHSDFYRWSEELEEDAWTLPDFPGWSEKQLDYNLRHIRALLEGFTNEGLRCFCYDVPDFKSVYDQLTQHTSKAQVVNHLIEYAEKRSSFKTLLAEVRTYNLDQYKHFNMTVPVDFQPSVARPLVYHLHGLDTNSASLVLTEENYFEFFEHISKDVERPESLPYAVRRALTGSTLILLGYDLHSWAFRVLFRGPIKGFFNQRHPLNLSIQLNPQPQVGIEDIESIRRYLEQYFRGYKFVIYWGDVASFTRELWSQWKG